MTDASGLARLAGLLADPSRAAFCLALLDGRAWTAGELARHAGIAASTASAHVTLLVDSGVLADERQGRHRYVRIADPAMAALIEDLAGHAAPLGTRPASRTLRESVRSTAIARARTCYDHLAGRLGVAITEALVERGFITVAGFGFTDSGLGWLGSLGVDVAALRAAARPMARACLDWTERRPHLAGSAGAALCEQAFARNWVERIGTGRALRLTGKGRRDLDILLGLTVPR